MNRVLILLLGASFLLPVSAADTALAADLAVILDVLDQADGAQADRALAERAKAFLTEPRYYRWLKPHTARIRPHLVKAPQDRDLEVLALLELTDADRAMIRGSAWSSDYMKARAGDGEAFARLAVEFAKASEPRKVMLHGLRMLYVGDRPAMELFAKRLGSPDLMTAQEPHPGIAHFHIAANGKQVVHGHAEDVIVTTAVALKLIEVYATVEHDVEGIDYLALREHLDISAEAFAEPQHQAFLRRFEQIFRERHGVAFGFTCPFLRTVTPIEHPAPEVAP